eukprot:IDg2221t1
MQKDPTPDDKVTVVVVDFSLIKIAMTGRTKLTVPSMSLTQTNVQYSASASAVRCESLYTFSERMKVRACEHSIQYQALDDMRRELLNDACAVLSAFVRDNDACAGWNCVQGRPDEDSQVASTRQGEVAKSHASV